MPINAQTRSCSLRCSAQNLPAARDGAPLTRGSCLGRTMEHYGCSRATNGSPRSSETQVSQPPTSGQSIGPPRWKPPNRIPAVAQVSVWIGRRRLPAPFLVTWSPTFGTRLPQAHMWYSRVSTCLAPSMAVSPPRPPCSQCAMQQPHQQCIAACIGKVSDRADTRPNTPQCGRGWRLP